MLHGLCRQISVPSCRWPIAAVAVSLLVKTNYSLHPRYAIDIFAMQSTFSRRGELCALDRLLERRGQAPYISAAVCAASQMTDFLLLSTCWLLLANTLLIAANKLQYKHLIPTPVDWTSAMQCLVVKTTMDNMSKNKPSISIYV